MKRGAAIFLLVIAVFLVACSTTTVVKTTTAPSTSAPSTPSQTQSTQTQAQTNASTVLPSTGGASISTEGKVPTKCEDTDGNDPSTIGRVRVTYSDGTTQDFYDACPGLNFETEYFCEGNDVKAKNNVCSNQCITVKVKDPSCTNCTVGQCFNLA